MCCGISVLLQRVRSECCGISVSLQRVRSVCCGVSVYTEGELLLFDQADTKSLFYNSA